MLHRIALCTRSLGLALLLNLPGSSAIAFTEPEDRPVLDPDQSEDNPRSDPDPAPYSLAPFLQAHPDGVLLVNAQLDTGDVDFVEVDLQAGDLLLLSVFEAGLGERHDTGLGVFALGGVNPVEVDDDSAAGFLSGAAVPVSQSGNWQIGVTGFSDPNFAGAHAEASAGLVPYELLIAVLRDPALREESDLDPGPQGSNDTPQTADPLSRTGGLIHASLGPGDLDYFSIVLEEGDRVVASVMDVRTGPLDGGDGELNDPLLALLDPQGGVFALDDDSGAGHLPNRGWTVPAGKGGTWNLVVTGFGDAALAGDHDTAPFDYALAVGVRRACPNVALIITGIVPPSSGHSYVAAALLEGDHYYTDRTVAGRHLLVDIPEPLQCGHWIKTANDDKPSTGESFLEFSVDRSARVWVGFDTRAAAPPDWLGNGFVDTGMILDIEDPDPNQEFVLYRRDYPAGSVVLGGNMATGASFPAGASNYTVVALPFASPSGSLQLFGTGEGGSVQLSVSGVVISVVTGPGATPAQVVAALAAAIDADPTLAALAINALATGNRLETNGDISNVSIADAGLSSAPTAMPGLPGPASALLAAALLLACLAGSAWISKSS